MKTNARWTIAFLALLACVSVQGQSDQSTNASAARGGVLYIQCSACHQLLAGGTERQGPHLEALFGRTMGGLKGYDYSEALRERGQIWDETTLDAWLKAPEQEVPGNKMLFSGVPSARDRADLIAYLKTATRPESARAR